MLSDEPIITIHNFPSHQKDKTNKIKFNTKTKIQKFCKLTLNHQETRGNVLGRTEDKSKLRFWIFRNASFHLGLYIPDPW